MLASAPLQPNLSEFTDSSLTGLIWTDGRLYMQIRLENLSTDKDAAYFSWDWLEVEAISYKSIEDILSHNIAKWSHKSCLAKLFFSDEYWKGVITRASLSPASNSFDSLCFNLTADLLLNQSFPKSSSKEERLFSIQGQVDFKGIFFHLPPGVKDVQIFFDQLCEMYVFLGCGTPESWATADYFRVFHLP